MANRILTTQIAVVGAGPAGIAAATRAAEAKADVLLLDEGAGPGGQIWRHAVGGRLPDEARYWVERFRRSGGRLLPGLQVVSAEPGRLHAESVTALREPIDVRARTIVLATGARERFLPFPGWTLPGVFGVGAAQALMKSGTSFVGKRVIVAGSGPLLLPAAASLAAGGARVSVVAEQAAVGPIIRFALGLLRFPGKLREAAVYRARFFPARYRTGVWIREALGESAVREVVLTDGRRNRSVPCDVLCCGYGLVPNLELPILLGCRVENGHVVIDEFQHSSLPTILCAGEATGVGGVDLALVEGEIAGLSAAGRAKEARLLFSKRSRLARLAASLEKTFALRPEVKRLARPDTIVCRCEDVAFERLDPSWTRRQAKLYTRAGMGLCQGRICGPALEFLFGWSADTVRIPLYPAPLSSFRSSAEKEQERTNAT